jgi:dephospho-CoA kinase
VQIARLVERGLTEAAARERLAAQWPTEQKTARADFVLRTDGSFRDTDLQIENVISALEI